MTFAKSLAPISLIVSLILSSAYAAPKIKPGKSLEEGKEKTELQEMTPATIERNFKEAQIKSKSAPVQSDVQNIQSTRSLLPLKSLKKAPIEVVGPVITGTQFQKSVLLLAEQLEVVFPNADWAGFKLAMRNYPNLAREVIGDGYFSTCMKMEDNPLAMTHYVATIVEASKVAAKPVKQAIAIQKELENRADLTPEQAKNNTCWLALQKSHGGDCGLYALPIEEVCRKQGFVYH